MKKVNQYSDVFKRQVVLEALSGAESLAYYRRKYELGGGSTLSRWIATFGAEVKQGIMSKQEENELERLKAELEVLKRELEQERLKRQAYQIMIRIAEETYRIPIEKKSGVKQSKK